MSRGKFLEVECSKCRNKQIIFNKTSTEVNCLDCGELLAKPTGGKAKLEVSQINEI